MKILIIEDDQENQDFLVQSLESEAFTVDKASDGNQGSYLARTNEYDLIILDLILPKKNGFKVCEEIRANGIATPVLMLSATAATEEKINLLNCGADDYLTKPFSFKELLARIRALLRRPKSLESEVFEISDLRLDSARQRVSRAGKEIYLTRKEFCLLEYMMRHAGRVVSRGMIMEHVWNADTDPFSNTIEAHILNIRKKIDYGHALKVIHTVPGRGYKIDIRP